jgi:hypothetical protein
VLSLSVALCVLNDKYREAERLGVQVDGVSVEADGNFDEEWCSTGTEYSVTIDARASTEERALELQRTSERLSPRPGRAAGPRQK